MINHLYFINKKEELESKGIHLYFINQKEKLESKGMDVVLSMNFSMVATTFVNSVCVEVRSNVLYFFECTVYPNLTCNYFRQL